MRSAEADRPLLQLRIRARTTCAALKRHFRPEFLNRIDEVIVFHELLRDEVKAIVDLMIRRIAAQLESQDVTIELTDAAKDFLARKGYDSEGDGQGVPEP